MGFVRSRLGVMMFLQYAVWGVWVPILPIYLQGSTDDGGLGFTDGQVGTLLGVAASIGAITAPLICSLADRRFSAERFLACLLFFGGLTKIATAFVTQFEAWLLLSIAYSVLFMPTLSLSNSVAFANLKDREKEFPYVRVFGTFGWIAASWIFPWVFLQSDLKLTALPPFLVGVEHADATARLANALIVSGVVSMLYAGYCFLLPHTPPKKEGIKSVAVFKAFGLLRYPSVLIVVLASLPISIIHQIYFMKAGPYLTDAIGLKTSFVAPAMSVGQLFEIIVLAGLGLLLKRLGFRLTLMIGGLGYVFRFGIWGLVALSDDVGSVGMTLAIGSQFLHGFCYACFFAAAYIYIDKLAAEDIRNSAQAVFGIMILGVGPVFSGGAMNLLSGWFGDGNNVTNYSGMWFALSGVALVTTILLFLLFRDQSTGDEAKELTTDEQG
jgi:nucleoside transporter